MVQQSRFSCPYSLQNCINTLLFGISDKTAGIDDDSPGIGFFTVVFDLQGISFNLPGQILTVDGILRTSQSNYVDFSIFLSLSFQRLPMLDFPNTVRKPFSINKRFPSHGEIFLPLSIAVSVNQPELRVYLNCVKQQYLILL